jgi:hypothetical protein
MPGERHQYCWSPDQLRQREVLKDIREEATKKNSFLFAFIIFIDFYKSVVNT